MTNLNLSEADQFCFCVRDFSLYERFMCGSNELINYDKEIFHIQYRVQWLYTPYTMYTLSRNPSCATNCHPSFRLTSLLCSGFVHVCSTGCACRNKNILQHNLSTRRQISHSKLKADQKQNLNPPYELENI